MHEDVYSVQRENSQLAYGIIDFAGAGDPKKLQEWALCSEKERWSKKT
jgi:hypothetical protein